jgi:hypothetical protein
MLKRVSFDFAPFGSELRVEDRDGEWFDLAHHPEEFEGRSRTVSMTTGFGFTVFVIPNLIRDLGLGFKAPPCGRGSLLY